MLKYTLDKYEYLTGEDLGYIPDPAQKAKLEYSPLGQIFNNKKDCLKGQRILKVRLIISET